MNERHLSRTDRLISGMDNVLRSVAGPPRPAGRSNPAAGITDADLDPAERRHAAGLMRVNHAGEVAAQALYRGHAAVARDAATARHMRDAAAEEIDHLDWCAERVAELGSVTSRLGPLWYTGAFAIGAASGAIGDRWSLGFVAETERQVADHLAGHLQQLPAADQRSRAIVERMREEEIAHGTAARERGAASLPSPVRTLMKLAAGVMKQTAYRI